MTGPDRDGLSLDRLEARLGPFLVGLPPGLAVDVVLQGGVVQEASVVALVDGPWPEGPGTTVRRHQLRWLAESCRLAGLDALAARAALLAAAHATTTTDGRPSLDRAVTRLVRAVARSGLASTWRRLGDDGAAAAHLEAASATLAAPGEADERGVVRSVVPGPAELGDRLLGLAWSDALVVIHSLDLSGAALPQRSA
jgi:hypothetical protein